MSIIHQNGISDEKRHSAWAEPSSKTKSLPEQRVTFRDYGGFAILVVINLLNYMDRYTVSGVLTQIQDYFSINDADGGLLQTVFIAFFTVCSPISGFLGDRFNRKWIIVAGISVWLAAVVASSFVPRHLFWLFAVLRGVVGVGEASYAVICPSMIADMFPARLRPKMLMIFYFAIPFGSGLGFIVGAGVANAFNDWRWGVRITAIFGVVCLLLLVLFLEEPPRGRMDIADDESVEAERGSYVEDIKALLKNATFVTSTIGYTAGVFVVGTLSWWVPTAIEHAEAARQHLNVTSELSSDDKSSVTFSFGIVTCVAGVVGVAIGTLGSAMMKKGSWCCRSIRTERSDAIMCALGPLIGLPTLIVAFQIIDHNQTVAYIVMFISITGLCFNWAINVDLLLCVVIPSRRATANSWQILMSHLFGDGSGPYIIGLLSDALRGSDDSPSGHFNALRNSFYVPNALLVLAVLFYVVSAFTFPRDRQRFHEECGHSVADYGSASVQIEVNGEDESLKQRRISLGAAGIVNASFTD